MRLLHRSSELDCEVQASKPNRRHWTQNLKITTWPSISLQGGRHLDAERLGLLAKSRSDGRVQFHAFRQCPLPPCEGCLTG